MSLHTLQSVQVKNWTLLGNNYNVENVRFTTVERWFSQKKDSILYHLHVRVSNNLNQLRSILI